MKALFLAGGMGTRMKSLTDNLPKPMVPMMVKPLLERNMIKLKNCGIDEIILSTCYKPQKFEEYFGDGSKFGLKIHYICEDIPLGTGGAIKNSEDFFNDTFIIFNADILSDINIMDMVKFHKEKNAAVTIAVTQVEDPSAYGVIEYNENLYAESFTEKPKPSEIKSNYINAGIYIFEPNVLSEIPNSQVVSIERDTYPLLLEKGYPIAVYKSDAYWIDIGTIEKYIKAHHDILSGAYPIPEYKDEIHNVFVGKSTIIHPSIIINAPVYIGENTKIGINSTIGPNTIIGNNCSVGINSTIIDSILWDNINNQSNLKVSDMLLDSNITNTKNILKMNTIESEGIKKKLLNIAFLSTSPPRECGIATFTQDLIDAIDITGVVDTNVIAINNSKHRDYSNKVIYEINQNHQQDYKELAFKLNNSNIDLLVIEHEYGIYGGDHGDYLLDLLNNINIPVITTLHTILREPNEKQKAIIKTLGEKSAKIITMAKNTSKLLKSVYGISPAKIQVIHHGVPVMLVPTREALKRQFGYQDKQLVSTFGLLSPGKGIEYAIEAIAKISKTNNNILYLILGQTHPDQGNESYREKLEALVVLHHLEENVKFVNKYLSKDEIIQYLQMSDIYITPYLSRDQAVSGTLAYAVGYGRAIVSTPYLYAKEMLSENRGLLAEFENSDSLFNCLEYIIDNPDKKTLMENNTIKLGETMYWHMVAKKYTDTFLKAIVINQEETGVV